MDAREVVFLRWIFVVAVLLRLLVAIGSYYALPYGYFAPDEVGYAAGAAQLASQPLDLTQAFTGQGWFYFNAVLIQLFGVDPLAPRLWNSVAGGIAPVLGYLLARKLGAHSGARLTAILLATFPSLVLWSSLNLKDVDVWCLILAGLLLTLRLRDSPRRKSVLGLALIIGALDTLRQYPALALLVCVGTGLLAPRLYASRRLKFAAGGLALAITVGALILPGAAQDLYSRLGLSSLATLRLNFTVGAQSAVDPDPGLQTLNGAVAFFPLGLVDFFLRPFPWELSSSVPVLIVPEIILYYAILPVVLVGAAHSLRFHFSRAVPVVTLLAVIGIGYAFVLGNLGTSYRERAQLLVVMFAFAGVGIHAVGLHLSRRRQSQAVETDRDLDKNAPLVRMDGRI